MLYLIFIFLHFTLHLVYRRRLRHLLGLYLIFNLCVRLHTHTHTSCSMQIPEYTVPVQSGTSIFQTT